MSNFDPVGNTIVALKLINDLYVKGFLVARAAPSQWQMLLEKLRIFQLVLVKVHERVVGSSNDLEPLQRALKQCFRTLKKFEVLLAKYSAFGKL